MWARYRSPIFYILTPPCILLSFCLCSIPCILLTFCLRAVIHSFPIFLVILSCYCFPPSCILLSFCLCSIPCILLTFCLRAVILPLLYSLYSTDILPSRCSLFFSYSLVILSCYCFPPSCILLSFVLCVIIYYFAIHSSLSPCPCSCVVPLHSAVIH
jgi:hypothetical protein